MRFYGAEYNNIELGFASFNIVVLCSIKLLVGSIITLLSSKFRLIYCFFLVKSWFFIEKVHILIYGLGVGISTIIKFTSGRGWGSRSHFLKQILQWGGAEPRG
jgi:hypothetical protein